MTGSAEKLLKIDNFAKWFIIYLILSWALLTAVSFLQVDIWSKGKLVWNLRSLFYSFNSWYTYCFVFFAYGCMSRLAYFLHLLDGDALVQPFQVSTLGCRKRVSIGQSMLYQDSYIKVPKLLTSLVFNIHKRGKYTIPWNYIFRVSDRWNFCNWNSNRLQMHHELQFKHVDLAQSFKACAISEWIDGAESVLLHNNCNKSS